MSLRRDCEGSVPVELLPHVPARFEVIGSVAIVSLVPVLHPYRNAIAAAIHRRMTNVHTVLNKTKKVNGEKRLAGYELISGDSTITTCKEYGFVYRLDVREVFFSPRLATERMRVARQIEPGESVLVLFAGVGPSVIPAAAAGARVTAIEQSTAACRWLEHNVRQNGVANRVTVIQGDAFDPALSGDRNFDRAIIPTPYGQDRILDIAVSQVRDGGVIHFTTFKKRHELQLLTRDWETGIYTVLNCHRCGNVAPNVCRWVVDLQVRL